MHIIHRTHARVKRLQQSLEMERLILCTEHTYGNGQRPYFLCMCSFDLIFFATSGNQNGMILFACHILPSWNLCFGWRSWEGNPSAASGWGNWSTSRFALGHWVKKMCRNNVMASFEWSVLSCLVEKFFALKVKWHKDITYLADNRHFLNFPQQWSFARRLLLGQKHCDRRGNLGGGDNLTVGTLEAMPHVFQ